MNARDDFLVILSSVGGTRLYGCFDEDIENSGISSYLALSASKEHSLPHTCAHTKPFQITDVREGVDLAAVVLFYFQGQKFPNSTSGLFSVMSLKLLFRVQVFTKIDK